MELLAVVSCFFVARAGRFRCLYGRVLVRSVFLKCAIYNILCLICLLCSYYIHIVPVIRAKINPFLLKIDSYLFTYKFAFFHRSFGIANKSRRFGFVCQSILLYLFPFSTFCALPCTHVRHRLHLPVIPSAARNLSSPSWPRPHRAAQAKFRFPAYARDSSLGPSASL